VSNYNSTSSAVRADLRVIGSATARMASRKWACPECAEAFGCRAGSRGCQTCSPPHNPTPVRDSEWDG